MSDEARDDIDVAAASFAQERIWVMEEMAGDEPTYNMQLGVRLRGALDVDALRAALAALVERHESLRTRLALREGRLVQLIHPPAAPDLDIRDLAASADPDAAWAGVVDEELGRPFDDPGEPPLRAALLRLRADDHVLLITIDHLVCDAWSVRVLHRDLTELYAAAEAGAGSPLPELTVQYADYADWQRRLLAGGEEERQLAFWARHLGDDPQRLALHRSPAADRTAGPGASSTVAVPDELIADLDAFTRRDGTSLFAGLFTAFGILLAQHSRQDDFVCGSLFGGRTRPELENLIGFFVNTVALRVDATGRPTFRELLHRVQGTVLDAYAHQDVPFEHVVAALATDHQPGRNQPFFDVMFQFADLSRAPVRTPSLSLEPIVVGTRPAPLDLVVALLKESTGYACVWDYHVDALDADAVGRMQRQFLTLLRAVVDQPDRPIDEYDLTGPDDRNAASDEPAADAPDDARADAAADGGDWSLEDRFAATAREHPDAIAVVADGVSHTYAAVDRQANQLAHLLRDHGVGPDVLVGIHLRRSLRQVVAVLAVLKAGGAFLPLDPDYPAPRLTAMIADAAPAVILTDRHAPLAADPIPGTSLVDLDSLDPTEADHPDEPPAPVADGDHLAYVIFTSGSTGRPKGAAVTCSGLRTVARAIGDVLGLTADDRVLRFASASFDAAVLELLMAFTAGASLHVMPADANALDEVAAFLAAREITAALLTPSTLAAFPDTVTLPSLRTLTVGGEPCPPALAARWATGRRLVNLYGPTEATIVTTYHEVTSTAGADVPIGGPLPGVTVHVVNGAFRPVPIGVPGELCVGGPAVARGYLHHAALTAERFVADPFGRPGGRLYRTGDLVRRTSQGTLQFLGRIDDQVKLRGFRIELGEVENTLATHGSVHEAAAAVHPDPAGTPHIIGYVVARPGHDADEAQLRDWCARTLPPFMVPTRILPVDQLPRTPSGKLDRRRLPKPPAPPAPDTRGDAMSPLETAVGDVWIEVLGVGAVKPDDDFFDLGGNSLTAIQATMRIADEFDLDLSVRTLFDKSVLSEFVEALRQVAADL